MRKIYVPLSMLLIGLSLGLTSYTPRTLSSNSDDNQRLVTEQKWKSQPVKVTDVRINGNIITLGQPFRANERDWIRELSFKVTNASDKQMSYARFSCNFP